MIDISRSRISQDLNTDPDLGVVAMADRLHTPEYLSAEELRNRLYHSLRNRGLVDSIKVNMIDLEKI